MLPGRHMMLDVSMVVKDAMWTFFKPQWDNHNAGL